MFMDEFGDFMLLYHIGKESGILCESGPIFFLEGPDPFFSGSNYYPPGSATAPGVELSYSDHNK